MDQLGKCVCCAYHWEKEKRYQSWPTNWKTNCSLSLRKENLSPQEFALRAEQRLETALRCFPKLEKNWTRQLTMNNYFDWKEWVSPLIPIHFFVIWLAVNHYPWEFSKHPAKNANGLGPAWQNLAGKSHIHRQKENGLELFKPLISRNKELYISKEAKTENALVSGYACHNLSVWNIFNKRQKFTFAQSKRFPPKRNLLEKENNYFGIR